LAYGSLGRFYPEVSLWGFFMTGFSQKELMTRALSLAQKGRGKTLPNPMVGAVLVKKGKVIAEGYHKGPGKPHAEIEAIKKADKMAKGATLYVNLEPCCHIGRTGPCTDSIVEAGIKKVVYAVIDPNPQVNGKGAKTLRRAGVEVTNGLLSKEAARLNEVYLEITENQRPFVTLKLAQSLDGRIATSGGDSKWISGEASRKYVHRLRAESDAVLVGAGTFKKDNPHLTTRLTKGKNPYRIIVSTGWSSLENSHLINDNSDFKTIVATSDESLNGNSDTSNENGLTFWSIRKDSQGRVDLRDLLEKAKLFGVNSILVEGGAEIATSFLKAKLVDKYVVITAPIIIGKGIDSVGDLGTDLINEAIHFNDVYRVQNGSDEIFVGYPDWSK